MHSLLDRSVHGGYGCFGVDFQSLLQVTLNLSERCIDKEYIIIWYNFQACCIASYSSKCMNAFHYFFYITNCYHLETLCT